MAIPGSLKQQEVVGSLVSVIMLLKMSLLSSLACHIPKTHAHTCVNAVTGVSENEFWG